MERSEMKRKRRKGSKCCGVESYVPSLPLCAFVSCMSSRSGRLASLVAFDRHQKDMSCFAHSDSGYKGECKGECKGKTNERIFAHSRSLLCFSCFLNMFILLPLSLLSTCFSTLFTTTQCTGKRTQIKIKKPPF